MTVFADAAGVLAADPNLFAAGTLAEALGTAPVVSVRAHVRTEDPDFTLGGAAVRAPGWIATIPTADLSRRPRERQVLTVGAQRFTVRGVRQTDGEEFVTLDLDPIAN